MTVCDLAAITKPWEVEKRVSTNITLFSATWCFHSQALCTFLFFKFSSHIPFTFCSYPAAPFLQKQSLSLHHPVSIACPLGAPSLFPGFHHLKQILRKDFHILLLATQINYCILWILRCTFLFEKFPPKFRCILYLKLI